MAVGAQICSHWAGLTTPVAGSPRVPAWGCAVGTGVPLSHCVFFGCCHPASALPWLKPQQYPAFLLAELPSWQERQCSACCSLSGEQGLPALLTRNVSAPVFPAPKQPWVVGEGKRSRNPE